MTKIILINTSNENQINIGPAEYNYGLKVLEEGLRTAGIDDVVLYPKEELVVFRDKGNIDGKKTDNSEFKEQVARDLVQIVGDRKDVVFGISVMTDRYRLAKYVAAIIRFNFPDLKLYIGGSHLAREKIVTPDGRSIRDSVEIALGEQFCGKPMFDAAFAGGGSGFVELAKAGFDNKKTTTPIKGMYYLKDEIVAGEGRGTHPENNNFAVSVLNTPDQTNYLRIMLKKGCPNCCDYCPLPSKKEDMPPLNKVVEALKKKQEKGELFGLELLDLIPFENEDISYYMALFEMLKNEKMYNIPGSYLDAHLLVDQEYRDILFRFFDHFMFRGFFIGRDCVDAEVAHKVGRRYTEYTDKDDGSTPTRKSRIRTQEDLDKELDAIKEFIALLNKTDYRLPIRRDLELSYLLTPFDTYSTTRKMLDEAEELIEMSSSRLFINTHFWILTPYPNTRLRKRYAHLMSDPENYHTQSVLANCWSYELGPQVYFMDKALELRTLKETEDISVYFHEMRKALDDAYAGKLSRKPDAARRFIQ